MSFAINKTLNALKSIHLPAPNHSFVDGGCRSHDRDERWHYQETGEGVVCSWDLNEVIKCTSSPPVHILAMCHQFTGLTVGEFPLEYLSTGRWGRCQHRCVDCGFHVDRTHRRGKQKQKIEKVAHIPIIQRKEDRKLSLLNYWSTKSLSRLIRVYLRGCDVRARDSQCTVIFFSDLYSLFVMNSTTLFIFS